MTVQTISSMAQPQAVALFISDLHLHQSRPETTATFLRFLVDHAAYAKQLYLLGDIFEYWAGDDDIDTPFHRQITHAFQDLQKSKVEIFWIGGNRDFLAGQGLMDSINARRLDDPYVAEITGLRIAVTHGDEQCTDDVKYMAFRKQVRNEAWQQQFLALPLEQRKAIIENVRKESETEQRGKTYEIMDVNSVAITELFKRTGTSVLIHGHTHRPAHHIVQVGEAVCRRIVLPDWECDGANRRGGWAAVFEDGSLRRFNIDGEELEVTRLLT